MQAPRICDNCKSPIDNIESRRAPQKAEREAKIDEFNRFNSSGLARNMEEPMNYMQTGKMVSQTSGIKQTKMVLKQAADLQYRTKKQDRGESANIAIVQFHKTPTKDNLDLLKPLIKRFQTQQKPKLATSNLSLLTPLTKRTGGMLQKAQTDARKKLMPELNPESAHYRELHDSAYFTDISSQSQHLTSLRSRESNATDITINDQRDY